MPPVEWIEVATTAAAEQRVAADADRELNSAPSDVVAAILAQLAVRNARPLAALCWLWKHAVEAHVSNALLRASHNFDRLTYAFPKLVVRRQYFGQCGFCGHVPRLVRAKLPVCSLCQQVHYCNRECQQQHWRLHRIVCVGRRRRMRSEGGPVNHAY